MKNIVLILTLILISCNNNSTSTPVEFDNLNCENLKSFVYDTKTPVNVNVKKGHGTIIADSIFSTNVDFIRLETKEECLIGKIDKILFSDSLIFVVDKRINKSVFIFNLEGKYINKIDKLGKGPGEYINIQDVDINLFKKHIAILDGYSRKINFYNFQGDFIAYQNTKPLIIYSFASIDSSNYILDKGRYPGNNLISETKNYRLLASNLKEIHSGGITVEESANDLHYNTQHQFWKFENKVFFNKPYHDTIYQITKDTIYKKYYLDLKGDNIPYKNKLNLSDNNIKELTSKYGYLNGLTNDHNPTLMFYSLKDF